MRIKKYTLLALCSVSLIGNTACSSFDGVESEAKYPTGSHRDGADTNDIYGERQSLFGEGRGLLSLGGDSDEPNVGIAVNSFLWRASLDTVSFLPITSADPFGGVILTDWYTPVETENERFKVNVFILSRQLRSDGIRVRVFRQKLKRGNWVDDPANDETAVKLEDAILTRARQLRVANISQ